MITINKKTHEVKFNQNGKVLAKKDFFKIADSCSNYQILKRLQPLCTREELTVVAEKLGTTLAECNHQWGGV